MPLCLAGLYEERVRLLETANEYRDMASRAEAVDSHNALNDLLRVKTVSQSGIRLASDITLLDFEARLNRG